MSILVLSFVVILVLSTIWTVTGRFLSQIAVSLSLSLLGGFAFSSVIGRTPGITSSTTLAAAALLFLPALALVRRLWSRGSPRRSGSKAIGGKVAAAPPAARKSERVRAAEVDERRPSVEARRCSPTRLLGATISRFRRPDPAVAADERLASAWDGLASEADWAASRIAVARTSCGRFLQLADRNALSLDALDFAVLIRKRIPELIRTCLAQCETATPSERPGFLEDAVEALERVAAEADRRRSGLARAGSSSFDIQRAHLAQRSAEDPLSPV